MFETMDAWAQQALYRAQRTLTILPPLIRFSSILYTACHIGRKVPTKVSRPERRTGDCAAASLRIITHQGRSRAKGRRGDGEGWVKKEGELVGFVFSRPADTVIQACCRRGGWQCVGPGDNI